MDHSYAYIVQTVHDQQSQASDSLTADASRLHAQLKGPHAGVPWGQTLADSPLLGGLFTASAVGGALLGVMLIFRIGDDIGRRRTLICGALLYGVGALLEALSSISAFHKDAGLTVAIVGRWVYGVACGFSMHGVSTSLQPRLGTMAGLVQM